MKQDPDQLWLNSRRCRDLASTALTEDAREILAVMAASYEQKAISLERAQGNRKARPAFEWAVS